MPTSSPSSARLAELRIAAGVSSTLDTISAAYQASEQCMNGLGESGRDGPDLAVVFFSPHHLTNVGNLSTAVRRRLSPRHLVGVSCEAVIGGSQEFERAPGISIMAGCFPGVTIKTYATEQFPVSDESAESLFMLRDVIGASEDLRFSLLLADPFSQPLIKTLPDLNRARVGGNGVIFGGLASASMTAGGNALLLDDRIVKSGGVGVSLRGNIQVDTVVSQGCRAFGPNMLITAAKNNLILEIGGKPAIEAVQKVLDEQGKARTKLIAGGMFVGIVIDEQKPRFGRDDFLIRKIMGVRPEEGAIAVAELVKPGQTIRLHTRDAETAHDDLAMLLDAQKLYEKPKGALLVTCNGRGRRLFKDRHHDAQTVIRAFSQASSGEELSKPGTPYYTGQITPPVPLAGFFGAGEIAPVAGRSFVHGQTACVAIFRDREKAL